MAAHEAIGKSDEWYTPRYIFEGLNCLFDLDVATPPYSINIPAYGWVDKGISANSLETPWRGFVWMNPPFGGRNGLQPWLEKFFEHGNGIALTPDRTSAPWWQYAAIKANGVLFTAGKVKFIRPDGSLGRSPSVGTCLWAAGTRANRALHDAVALGAYMPLRR